MTKFWASILSSKNTNSSKRLVTLIIAGLFILSQIDILFLVNYIVSANIKGQVNKELLVFLKDIMWYDFILISLGLGFTTAENLIQIQATKSAQKIDAITDIAKESINTSVETQLQE